MQRARGREREIERARADRQTQKEKARQRYRTLMNLVGSLDNRFHGNSASIEPRVGENGTKSK